MNCPDCTQPLVHATHEGIEHGSCPSGHGHFFLHANLRAAMLARQIDRPESEEARAMKAQGAVDMRELPGTDHVRSCPDCAKDMTPLTYAYESGVVVDTCGEHGVWLDAGELERIEAWFEGNERIDRAEKDLWHARLDVIEMSSDRAAARDEGSIHWGPIGWLASRASHWSLQRDDRERRAG